MSTLSSTGKSGTSKGTNKSGEKDKSNAGPKTFKLPKRPPHLHAVFKTKAKAKSLFGQLDVTKRKRLTRDEFVSGIRTIFAQENLEISELGLEMLWEQMAKDETGKCSWAEFASRFVADPASQFTLAERPKTEEELKAEMAPKKIAPTDFKKIQEALYTALKKWHYINVDFGLSSESKTYSKAELRRALLTLFAAERYEADYLGRTPESWSAYMSVNDADLDKLFSFISWTKKGSAKADDLIPGLERAIPASKRSAPDAATLEALARIPGLVGASAREAAAGMGSLDGGRTSSAGMLSATGSVDSTSGGSESATATGLSQALMTEAETATLSPVCAVVLSALQTGAVPMPPENTLASALRDAPEFKSVNSDQLGTWVLENIFNALNGTNWMNSIRTMRYTPFQGPLLIFPPLVHWTSPTHDAFLRRAVLSIEDTQVVQGSLILLSDSMFISAVKLLPVALPGNTMSYVHVIYAQFLYVCQVTKPRDASAPEAEDETSVVQWMMRVKFYVSPEERPLYLLMEDTAVSVNTEMYAVPTSKSFSDWDLQSIEFSRVD